MLPSGPVTPAGIHLLQASGVIVGNPVDLARLRYQMVFYAWSNDVE